MDIVGGMTAPTKGWNPLDAGWVFVVFFIVALFAADRVIAKQWVLGGVLAAAACLLAIPAIRAFRGMDGRPLVDYERLGRTFRWW
jgi:hypothetical protein